MLNDIRVHIHSDDAIQEDIEKRSAPVIAETYAKNRAAFSRTISHLNTELDAIRSENISIFCNKHEQYNIVDFGLGRTLYGENPDKEMQEQCDLWAQYSGLIRFHENQDIAGAKTTDDENDAGNADSKSKLAFFQQSQAQVTKHAGKTDVLVILGLGLARHVKPLIEKVKESGARLQHVIIYEPEAQYFKSACMVEDWESLLAYFEQEGISSYFQIGKNADGLVSDIIELQSHFSIHQALVFQHYYHATFDAILHTIRNQSWEQLKADIRPFKQQKKYTQYTPQWLESQAFDELDDVSINLQRFQNNLDAFKQYYPDIYTEFKDYQCDSWQVVENKNHDINLLNQFNGATWYGASPKTEGEQNYRSFEKHPNKDGLILGYNGQKLKHYLHYRLVKKTESLLEQAEDDVNMLPDTIKSLILFGLGAGYELESLLAHKEVEKLFICEPNRDFFYASLYAIDWHAILQKLDDSGANLYINIGDDGSHLFRDLLGQFYNIGPYVLSQTFFYQGYYNAALNAAIGQLREQLQIVVSMGEYFDHACFAIEHTKEALRQQIPFLKAKPSQYLNSENKELPILFVGNGPSLDYSIETIKELQGQAIVVSCGTSLQVLHRNNIVPDFHAEIELNRATYDWACRVGDPDFLKQITLLSCNGIHPDTCALYKDVLIAFKEGESATVSALNVIGEEKAECLAFAFPTVSNFAVNLFLKLGFHQFYLFGIDMGFVDSSQHHSSQSGYYNPQGKELYKYAEANNTGLLVPGNFRTVVNTKHEFKLAKTIIEQALASVKVDCYNTSDGALITGATPLDINNILLMTTSDDKEQALNQMQTCFETLPANEFIKAFETKYQHHKLMQELDFITSMLDDTAADVSGIKNQEDIFALVEKQKQFLFYSYKQGESLFFYYLYGSMNYINSVLSKAAMHHDASVAVSVATKAIEYWRSCLTDVKLLLGNKHHLFDTSSSFTLRRERILLADTKQQAHFVCFSEKLLSLAQRDFSELQRFYPLTLDYELIQSLSSIDLKATAPPINNILMLSDKAEWRLAKAYLEQLNQASLVSNDGKKVKLIICIACDYESEWIASAGYYENNYSSVEVTFHILPSLAENTNPQAYREGKLPCSPCAMHLESVIKHLPNTAKQFIFMEKLDFSEVGLKPAYSTQCDSEESRECEEKSEVGNATHQQEPIAAKFVNEVLLQELSAICAEPNFYFIDYKTYIAIPRVYDDQDSAATFLDKAGSRGLRVDRPFTALEFLLRWQKPALVEKNITEFMKAG